MLSVFVQVQRTGSPLSFCSSTGKNMPSSGTSPRRKFKMMILNMNWCEINCVGNVVTVLCLQDGSAAHPDLSGILSVCQWHPIHRHWHADTSVRPPQGQNHLRHLDHIPIGPISASLAVNQHMNSPGPKLASMLTCSLSLCFIVVIQREHQSSVLFCLQSWLSSCLWFIGFMLLYIIHVQLVDLWPLWEQTGQWDVWFV